MVFNKMDRFGCDELVYNYRERFPESVGISAMTGEGIPELLGRLGRDPSARAEFV